MIDEKNRIYLLSSHRALVDCKLLGKNIFFINGDDGEVYTEVNDLIMCDSFDTL